MRSIMYFTLLFVCGISVLLFGRDLTVKPVAWKVSEQPHFGGGGDGWVEQGTSLDLPRLASFGNYLEIKPDSWRPPGIPVSPITVTACGTPLAHFTPDSSNHI